MFHAAKIKKGAAVCAAPVNRSGYSIIFVLEVGARATITAMASFEEEQGGHECEGEILLPIFHYAVVILKLTMLFLKSEKKTESVRAYCCKPCATEKI